MKRLLQTAGWLIIQFGQRRTCLLVFAFFLAGCLENSARGQAIDIPKIDVPRTQPTPIPPSPITSFPVQPVPIAPAVINPVPIPQTPVTLFPINPTPVAPAYTPSTPVVRLPQLGTPGLSSGGSVYATPPPVFPVPAGAPVLTNQVATNPAATNATSSTASLGDTNLSSALDALLRSLNATNAPATPSSTPTVVPGTAPVESTPTVPTNSPAKSPDSFIYPT